MSKRTEPVPAPAGWEWKVLEGLGDSLKLALIGPDTPYFLDRQWPYDFAFFEHESQIRRISKRVRRMNRKRLARTAEVEYLITREF